MGQIGHLPALLKDIIMSCAAKGLRTGFWKREMSGRPRINEQGVRLHFVSDKSVVRTRESTCHTGQTGRREEMV